MAEEEEAAVAKELDLQRLGCGHGVAIAAYSSPSTMLLWLRNTRKPLPIPGQGWIFGVQVWILCSRYEGAVLPMTLTPDTHDADAFCVGRTAMAIIPCTVGGMRDKVGEVDEVFIDDDDNGGKLCEQPKDVTRRAKHTHHNPCTCSTYYVQLYLA